MSEKGDEAAGVIARWSKAYEAYHGAKPPVMTCGGGWYRLPHRAAFRKADVEAMTNNLLTRLSVRNTPND